MIPIGFCQCGCGQQTLIARNVRCGNTVGQPLKYIKNHSPQCHKSRAAYKKKIRLQGKALVFEYLKTHPCIDCGESDPVVLDLDHRDPSQKAGSIADMVNRVHSSIATITAEIEKCDVRCANCHRRKHAKDKQVFCS